MKFRIIDLALLVAAIAGAIIAARSARTLHALQADHARLSRTVGGLVVTDPALLHVLAIETGEPFHFAWRVYAPAGEIVVSESSGGDQRSSGTDHHSKPREFIARIRFTEGRSDQAAVYSTFRSGASYWSFGSTELYRFLIEHRDQLHIEQLGERETARIKPGESATLLRVSMPESLAAEARKQLRAGDSVPFVPHVFECRVELKP